MRQKSIVLILLLIFGMSTSELKAQKLIIRFIDGSDTNVSLNTVQKLAFSVSDLIMMYKSGSSGSYGLSTIRKLYFDSNISIDENSLLISKALNVFPNPAENSITVQGIPDEADRVNIYKIDGQRVLTEAVSLNKAIIDISRLQPGLYLVNALSRTTKFIKQ
jgi:hypothetical protein